ncbi:hypothetical protein QE152_g14005 [Popillia japonica]|uniref:Uncharacterized protein n=1 Tax=Popillia japonica TaxID=7064 RepID=A0AAW1LBG7_POPJA
MEVIKKIIPNKFKNLPSCSKIIKKKATEVSDSSSDEGDSEVVYNDESDEEDNDAECLFCTKLYSADKHGEQWVKCTKCYRWAHEGCGAEDENFTCMCQIKK